MVGSGWAVGCGVREKPIGSSGSGEVTPAGATIPSWRVSVVAIPYLFPRVGENPRTLLGSSFVDVASLLGGANWHAADRSLGLW